MKVLVFPHHIRGNPYFDGFLGGMRAAGMQDIGFPDVIRLRSDFDVMHVHHPEHVVTQGNILHSLISTALMLLLAVYARVTGRPIVWMVHDVEPAWVRRKPWLDAFMWLFTHLATAYVFLNQSSQQHFYQRNAAETRKPSCFVVHSRFQTTVYDKAETDALRAQHGVKAEDLLISFLGDIKPHKGLESVALLPDQATPGRPVKIAVCGKVDRGLALDEVDAFLRGRSRNAYIRVDHRLTDDELALWIQASDAVFIPYSRGSNSGMAFNVLSNHGRIIASDLPMFREIEMAVGGCWIRCVNVRDAGAIQAAVNALPSWASQPRDTRRLDRILDEGNPIATAQTLRDFYLRLKQRPSIGAETPESDIPPAETEKSA